MHKPSMAWLGIALMAVASVFGIYLVDQNTINCNTESLPYKTEEVTDERITKGEKTVDTEGVNGQIEYCYKKDNQY